MTPFLRPSEIPIADLQWYRRDAYPDFPIEPQRTQVYRLHERAEWESIVAARWSIYTDVLGMHVRAVDQLELVRGRLADAGVGSR